MSDHVWYQIREHEGERFNLGARRFRYSVETDSIVAVDLAMDSSRHLGTRLAKTDVNKAIALWPVDPDGLKDLAGGAYIYAILSDSRIERDEERVIHAFCNWLTADDWIVNREVEFVDVVAERAGERLFAEVKGETAGPARRNVDILYGQLLRRMTQDERLSDRYAVVVPVTSLEAALKVPARIRALMRIQIFVVDQLGDVTEAHL
jgi:hypothetical protein